MPCVKILFLCVSFLGEETDCLDPKGSFAFLTRLEKGRCSPHVHMEEKVSVCEMKIENLNMRGEKLRVEETRKVPCRKSVVQRGREWGRGALSLTPLSEVLLPSSQILRQPLA